MIALSASEQVEAVQQAQEVIYDAMELFSRKATGDYTSIDLETHIINELLETIESDFSIKTVIKKDKTPRVFCTIYSGDEEYIEFKTVGKLEHVRSSLEGWVSVPEVFKRAGCTGLREKELEWVTSVEEKRVAALTESILGRLDDLEYFREKVEGRLIFSK